MHLFGGPSRLWLKKTYDFPRRYLYFLQMGYVSIVRVGWYMWCKAIHMHNLLTRYSPDVQSIFRLDEKLIEDRLKLYRNIEWHDASRTTYKNCFPAKLQPRISLLPTIYFQNTPQTFINTVCNRQGSNM